MKKYVIYNFCLFTLILITGCQTYTSKSVTTKATPEKTPPLIEGKRYSCVDYDLRMLMEAVDTRGEEFGGDTHFTNHKTESEVFFSYSLYETIQKANYEFDRSKSESKKSIRETKLKDSKGKEIGKKLVFYAEKKLPISEQIEKDYNLIWTKGSKLYHISSESLEAFEEIEKDCNLE